MSEFCENESLFCICQVLTLYLACAPVCVSCSGLHSFLMIVFAYGISLQWKLARSQVYCLYFQ